MPQSTNLPSKAIPSEGMDLLEEEEEELEEEVREEVGEEALKRLQCNVLDPPSSSSSVFLSFTAQNRTPRSLFLLLDPPSHNHASKETRCHIMKQSEILSGGDATRRKKEKRKGREGKGG